MMLLGYRFNRHEFAGSFGDLGTILPISVGMIVINGIDPLGLFFSVGLFYIFSGAYFRVTTPVEPMKVIGAYAIASGVSTSQIAAAGVLMGVLLLLIGATGAIDIIVRFVPKPVIRGVQLSTGILLMSQGVRLMMGTSRFQALNQAAEPYMSIQSLGWIPIGIPVGVGLGLLTLFLLDNKKIPAALVILSSGLLLGIFFGTHEGLGRAMPGINIPKILPFGFPDIVDFSSALIVLTVPQLPMTLGNAVIANADLSQAYFEESARRTTPRALCISMALANLISFILGGIPMCHGAGGLASRYRFGARTAGSNIIIGAVFIILAVLLGRHILSVIYLMPMAVLGVMLLFAGSQLGLTILDMDERKDLFVSIVMLGITISSNLAVAFIAGIALVYILRSKKVAV